MRIAPASVLTVSSQEFVMSFYTTQTNAYADLGEIWFRDQTARLRQKHLQSGQHFRLEIDALLAQPARRAQAARTIERPIAHDGGSTDRIRRAAIEAIEQCARLEIHPSAGVVEAIAG